MTKPEAPKPVTTGYCGHIGDLKICINRYSRKPYAEPEKHVWMLEVFSKGNMVSQEKLCIKNIDQLKDAANRIENIYLEYLEDE